jgi:CXXX repeat radical SAM target protein
MDDNKKGAPNRRRVLGKALPALAVLGLAMTMPLAAHADCENSCTAACATGCEVSCMAECATNCETSCKGGCKDDCVSSCKGSLTSVAP